MRTKKNEDNSQLINDTSARPWARSQMREKKWMSGGSTGQFNMTQVGLQSSSGAAALVKRQRVDFFFSISVPTSLFHR